MLILFCVIIVVAYLLERSSLNLPSSLVKYSCTASKRAVDPGETFELTTIIENNTNKSIRYLQLEEYIPNAVTLIGLEDHIVKIPGSLPKYVSHIYLKKKKRLYISKQAFINKRGVFSFRDTKMIFGDFLGMKDKYRNALQNQKIIVFPKRLKDERIDRVLSDVNGDIIVRSFINPDPMLIRGYRDYTGSEPMKSISFSQSARYDELMVKEYDHTNKEVVNIILDTSYVGQIDDYFLDREATFSLARTLCEGFEERQISYRLIMNCYFENAESHGVNVMESSGNGASLLGILEALGAASGIMCSTEDLVRESFSRYHVDKDFIFVSLSENESISGLLQELQGEYATTLHILYGSDFKEEKAC